MKRLITLDIAPATATHCGLGGSQGRPCSQATTRGRCRAFGRQVLGVDLEANEYLRLPECLAAEKGASE